LCCRFKRLRGPASSFIINLAIADLANSLLHSMAATSSFRGRWSFGATGLPLLFASFTFTLKAEMRAILPQHNKYVRFPSGVDTVDQFCLHILFPPEGLNLQFHFYEQTLCV
jgi:hypothetical protein